MRAVSLTGTGGDGEQVGDVRRAVLSEAGRDVGVLCRLRVGDVLGAVVWWLGSG